MRAASPSGLVPVLEDGPMRVWDSLAIAEYLAERFPEEHLWPDERGARAVARAVSAEMHSGFAALRSHMTMNVRADLRGKGRGPGVDGDIERVLAIWSDCRARFGAGGDFLFGRFSVADAMYAPVVSRFRTYGVTLSGVAREYADAIWALPAMQDWVAAAHAEPWTIEEYER
jgi:glutathione S-transferase